MRLVPALTPRSEELTRRRTTPRAYKDPSGVLRGRAEQAQLLRTTSGLPPCLDVELAVDVLEVCLDGVDGQEKLGCDLRVGHHRGHEPEDEELAIRERHRKEGRGL